jgi:hypothetical protein
MSPNSNRRSIHRHPFRFSFLLLALLAAAGGFSGRARLEARQAGTTPAAEMPFTSRAASGAVEVAGVMLKDGRDFAGFYEEENATDLGETYYVSVNFQIFNYSNANVSGATVCLSNRLTNEPTWSSAAIAMEDRRSVVIAAEFTIPLSEYEYWQKGGTPYLFIEYRNAQGDEVRRTIELTRKPAGEVQ